MEEGEIRRGTVLSVADGWAMVRLAVDDADCGGCRSCAMRSLCQGKEYGKMDLRLAVPPALEGKLEPGREVPVRYLPAHAGFAGVALFLPALVGLALGGWAGWRLGNGADAALLAGCAVGLLLGVSGTFVLNRTVRSLHPHAELLVK